MSEQENAANAAEKKAKADAEAKKKAEAEAKKKADAEAAAKQPKRVMVILENGTLGHLLLKKGDVTEDPEYVALLDDERGRTLVREVK